MVGGVFDAFDGGSFKGLVGIGSSSTLSSSASAMWDKPLRTSGLSCAARADLRGIVAELIELQPVDRLRAEDLAQAMHR